MSTPDKNNTLEAEFTKPDGSNHTMSVDMDDQTAQLFERIVHHSLTLTALINKSFDVPEGSTVSSIKLTKKDPSQQTP